MANLLDPQTTPTSPLAQQMIPNGGSITNPMPVLNPTQQGSGSGGHPTAGTVDPGTPNNPAQQGPLAGTSLMDYLNSISNGQWQSILGQDALGLNALSQQQNFSNQQQGLSQGALDWQHQLSNSQLGIQGNQLGIQGNAMARQGPLMDLLNSIQNQRYGMQGQAIDEGQKYFQGNMQRQGDSTLMRQEQQTRGKYGQEATSGALGASGFMKDFSEMQKQQAMDRTALNDQYAHGMFNFGQQRQGLGLNEKQSQAQFNEQKAGLQDQVANHNLAVQQLGLSQADVNQRYEQGIKQLGLQGTITATQIQNSMQDIKNGIPNQLGTFLLQTPFFQSIGLQTPQGANFYGGQSNNSLTPALGG